MSAEHTVDGCGPFLRGEIVVGGGDLAVENLDVGGEFARVSAAITATVEFALAAAERAEHAIAGTSVVESDERLRAVTAVVGVADEAEALELANCDELPLDVAVFTADHDRAIILASMPARSESTACPATMASFSPTPASPTLADRGSDTPSSRSLSANLSSSDV